MSLNQIVTPLDSATLETKEQYVFYHHIVTHAIDVVLKGLETHSLCNTQEVVLIKQYMKLFLYSLEMMRVKYKYDEEHHMKIDVTESGFPNYLEFRYLINDLALRNEHINRLPKVEELKEKFLDTLLKDKTHISEHQLFQAASILYYSDVEEHKIFKRFIQGKILKANAHNAQYMVSWCFYDVSLNRPFLNFMYFDYSGDVEDLKDDLYTVLLSTADRSMSLDTLAYLIDKKLYKVYPKLLRRLDLGPIHSVFAKDENIFTHQILKSIVSKDLPLSSYALTLSIDNLTTKGTFKEGSFFMKQTLQHWDKQPTEKYLFAPHRVLQMLYHNVPETITRLSKSPFLIDDLEIDLKKKEH